MAIITLLRVLNGRKVADTQIDPANMPSTDEKAGIAGLSALNTPLTATSRGQVPRAIDYSYFGGFAAGQTDIPIYESTGTVQQVTQKAAGSLVGIEVHLESNRTAGTLTIEPTINGTKVTPSDLDITIDGATVNNATAAATAGTTGLTFTINQRLGVAITSDGSWAPTNATIKVTLLVVYDS